MVFSSLQRRAIKLSYQLSCINAIAHKPFIHPYPTTRHLYIMTDSVADQIKALGSKLRELKTSKADKSEIDAVANQLKELNKQEGSGWSGDRRCGEEGTKDFIPEEMAVREKIFSSITDIFKRHGAVTIDTPVFELKDILTGKYGEDSKLIYDLQDQGGELCSLRYDLTVPFARFLAANTNISNMKRYHIAKVYRRDNPSVNKGRMREFYQCDLDIAGEYGPMIPDSEALRIMVEIINSVNVGDYVIKLNHRKILDGMFEVCGVPADKFRTISSAVDKLDKATWEEVKKEMTVEKGLSVEAADQIGEYVKLSGGAELCDVLLADAKLMKSAAAKAGVEDMRLLFKYLTIFGVEHKMSFDLSLARAVLTAKTEETSGVGSIASGGRYDETRRYASSTRLRTTSTQVYLVGLGTGFLTERMEAARELWDAGVSTEFTYKEKPRRDAQFKAAADEGVPVVVVLDNERVGSGTVQIENAGTGERTVVKREELVVKVKEILGL
ncbi:hypothetical protein BC829DRAFT_408791 [Chytridium lagenaria]|nr:hypothetical protein BC829DRAFT_408791 [Chytridium lagenaria]